MYSVKKTYSARTTSLKLIHTRFRLSLFTISSLALLALLALLPLHSGLGKLAVFYPLNDSSGKAHDHSGNALHASPHEIGRGLVYESSTPNSGQYGSLTLTEDDSDAFEYSINFGTDRSNYGYFELSAEASQTVASWIEPTSESDPRLHGNLTLSAWVQVHSISGRQTLFSSGSADGTDGWWIGMYNGRLSWGSGTNITVTTADRQLNLGDWHHLCVRINNQSISLFINGEQQTIETLTSLNYINELEGSRAYIGIDPSNNHPFYGKIAQLKIEQNSLEDGAIAALAKPYFWRLMPEPFWGLGTIADWNRYYYYGSNFRVGGVWENLNATGYTVLYKENDGILPDGTGIFYAQVENYFAPELSNVLTLYPVGETASASETNHSRFIAELLHGQGSGYHRSPNNEYHFPRGCFVTGARGTVSYTTGHFRERVLRTNWYGRTSDQLPGFEAPSHRFDILNISNTMGHGDYIYTEALDYFIKKEDIIAITTQPGSLSTNSSTSGVLWNSIVVGKNSTDHTYFSGTEFNNVNNRKRPKPDIASFNGSSSFAAPTVSSSSALLLSLARSKPRLKDNGAERSVVIKAALMAGAVKANLFANYTDDNTPINGEPIHQGKHRWRHTPDAPLDPFYGSGYLNIANAYWILDSGTLPVQTTASPPSSPQDLQAGWHRRIIDGSGKDYYFFKIAESELGRPFSALLTWHRDVALSEDKADFIYQDIPKVKIELWNYQNPDLPSLSTYSDDPGNNVEHIYLKDGFAQAGNYCLIVEYSAADQTEYGIALRNGYHPITESKPSYTIEYSSIQENTRFDSMNPLSAFIISNEPPHINNLLSLFRDGFHTHSLKLTQKNTAYPPDRLSINEDGWLDGTIPYTVEAKTHRYDFEILDKSNGKTATVQLNFNIADRTYQAWINQFRGLSEAQRTPMADPDKDGMSNAQEFFLNGHPSENNQTHTRNQQPLGLYWAEENGHAQLRLDSHFSDLPHNFRFESSSDLSQWDSLEGSPRLISDPEGGQSYFQWDALIDQETEKKFIRQQIDW